MIATLTSKVASLYVAYTPEFGMSAYGGCQDEALNNLADDIRQQMPQRQPAMEGRADAVN